MTLAFGAWHSRDAYQSARTRVDGAPGYPGTITLSFRRSPGEVRQFTYTASGTYGDDTYMEWARNRVAAAEAYPRPIITRRTWLMPWHGEAGVQFRFVLSGSYIKDYPISSVGAADPSEPPALPLAPVLPMYSWPEVRPAAKRGQWVRRMAWPTSRRLTYRAGAGTTRAVGMIEDNTGLRVAQAADFGRAEFVGFDWVIVPTSSTPPPPVDPARPPQPPIDPNEPTPSDPDSIAGIPTPPETGKHVLGSEDGALVWFGTGVCS